VGLSNLFIAKLLSSRTITKCATAAKKCFEDSPALLAKLGQKKTRRNTSKAFDALAPLFEELGFNYIGSH